MWLRFTHIPVRTGRGGKGCDGKISRERAHEDGTREFLSRPIPLFFGDGKSFPSRSPVTSPGYCCPYRIYPQCMSMPHIHMKKDTNPEQAVHHVFENIFIRVQLLNPLQFENHTLASRPPPDRKTSHSSAHYECVYNLVVHEKVKDLLSFHGRYVNESFST